MAYLEAEDPDVTFCTVIHFLKSSKPRLATFYFNLKFFSVMPETLLKWPNVWNTDTERDNHVTLPLWGCAAALCGLIENPLSGWSFTCIHWGFQQIWPLLSAVSYIQNTKTPYSTLRHPSLQMVHVHITSYHLFWTSSIIPHTHTRTAYATIQPTTVSKNSFIFELPTNPLPGSHCLFLTAGASANPRRVSHHSDELHW